nr:hypothetical protein [Nannocystis sp.]
MFEREIHEQHGIGFKRHPWLKPVRFEGKNLGRMNDYAFFHIEGKEVHEVNVGPIHAGVIEPGAFRFSCHGEVVYHLEIHNGYQHRGVERLLLERPLAHLPALVERIAGDSSIAYAWAHASAIEALAGVTVDPTVEQNRAVGLELERIAMHLVGLSGLTTDIGFLQGSSTYGRIRTAAINASMRVCGSRFGRDWLRPAAACADHPGPRRRPAEGPNATVPRDRRVQRPQLRVQDRPAPLQDHRRRHPRAGRRHRPGRHARARLRHRHGHALPAARRRLLGPSRAQRGRAHRRLLGPLRPPHPRDRRVRALAAGAARQQHRPSPAPAS